MRSLVAPTTLTLGLLLVAACSQQPSPQPAPAAAAEPARPDAVAVLAPTAGSQVAGTLDFTRAGGRVHVSGEVSGLSPDAEYGFHIHEKGDCSAADGSSAGGHFNPADSEHGRIDTLPHHAGDMPNLRADDKGVARVDGVLAERVTVADGGQFDIMGRGLIVHAAPDDYVTQPTGNAGARLACAVIQDSI